VELRFATAAVRGVATASLLTAIVVLAGCAPHPANGNHSDEESPPGASARRWSQSPGDTSTEAPPNDVHAADEAMPTPLAAYALTAREMATLDYARKTLWRGCLGDFGFDYPVPPFKTLLTQYLDGERETVGRWFGVTDRAVAKTYGMLLPPSQTDDIEEKIKDLDEAAFELALWGARKPDWSVDPDGAHEIDGIAIPEGGCDGEASRRLGQENLMNFGDKARDLMFSSSVDFQNSAEYQELQRDWASCMSKAGYPSVNKTYNDPFTMKLIGSRKNPDKASSEEIELALQSIDCMEETDLQARALKLRAAFDQNLIEKHQLELQENRKKMDEQVRRATDEVEKAGGFQ
jgi:hypothetical protein